MYIQQMSTRQLAMQYVKSHFCY